MSTGKKNLFWHGLILAVIFIAVSVIAALALIESQEPPTPGSKLTHPNDVAQLALVG